MRYKVNLPDQVPAALVEHPALYMYNGGCYLKGELNLYKVGGTKNISLRLYHLHHAFPLGLTVLWLWLFKSKKADWRSIEAELHTYLELVPSTKKSVVFQRLNPTTRAYGRSENYIASSCTLMQKKLDGFVKRSKHAHLFHGAPIVITCKAAPIYAVDLKRWISNPDNGIFLNKQAVEPLPTLVGKTTGKVHVIYRTAANAKGYKYEAWITRARKRVRIPFGTAAEIKLAKQNKLLQWADAQSSLADFQVNSKPVYWTARYLFGFQNHQRIVDVL